VPYTFTRTFKKRLGKKPAAMQAAILECVNRLMTDPRHPGLNMHRVQGHPGVWEAYVDQGNRVTFEREGENLTFRMNCNHDILRRP
jgi:hypothetical protein